MSAETAAPGHVRFEHGQRLSARDLDVAIAVELASGSNHVVGAHNTWGIVLGLEARLRSGHEIAITPGVAYDAWGRTLLVPAALRLEAPSDDAIVVARWDTGTASVRALTPGDVLPGRDVPLASLTKGASELDAGVRRCARTRAQPRIGAGSFTTTLAFTPSQRMRVMTIDTRGAAFVETPSYAVSTIGDLELPPRLGPIVSIADPTPGGFKVEVRYALPPGETAIGRSIQARVIWLGVEPRGGCPRAALTTLSPFMNLEEGPA